MTYFSSETIKKASEKDQKRMKRKTLKCCKKKIPSLKFHFQQNYPSKMKMK